MMRAMNLLKSIVKKTPIYPFLYRFKKKRVINNWHKAGKPIPPPHIIKQKIVKQYARKFSIDILVETGTYLGEMIDAVKDSFNEIYSIELDPSLYMKVKRRFVNIKNIHIIQGDSSKVLSELLALIDQPCLFWLDAHYSGGITAKANLNTPIMIELKSIFSHKIKGHVILIDDARCFTGQEDYPTIRALKEFVMKNRPDYLFEVKNDIIRIHKYMLDNIPKDKFKKINK